MCTGLYVHNVVYKLFVYKIARWNICEVTTIEAIIKSGLKDSVFSLENTLGLIVVKFLLRLVTHVI